MNHTADEKILPRRWVFLPPPRHFVVENSAESFWLIFVAAASAPKNVLGKNVLDRATHGAPSGLEPDRHPLSFYEVKPRQGWIKVGRI